MQARISQSGAVVVVHLLGRIDIETAESFRRVCHEKLSQSPVVFNFQNLSFVGSTGILQFLETVESFKKSNQNGLRFSNVGIEFKRLFAATPLNDVPIYENFELASLAFIDATIPSIPHEYASAPENQINFESLFAASDLAIDESASAEDDSEADSSSNL